MIYENIKKSFRELKWYEYLMGAIMIFIAARAMVIGFTTGSADGNPPWLTVINFISAVCGVICIFFTAKANISNFVFASVNTIVYAVYLVYWHIWGTALLEILFYIPMNFVSWYFWAKHRDLYVTFSKAHLGVNRTITRFPHSSSGLASPNSSDR